MTVSPNARLHIRRPNLVLTTETEWEKNHLATMKDQLRHDVIHSLCSIGFMIMFITLLTLSISCFVKSKNYGILFLGISTLSWVIISLYFSLWNLEHLLHSYESYKDIRQQLAKQLRDKLEDRYDGECTDGYNQGC